MEYECNPSRDVKRRLNPPMMEAAKKEILKLLDAGMIYPISDNKWVSPTGIPVFTKSRWHRKTKKRQPLHVHLAVLHNGECRLDCVTPRPLSNVVCSCRILSNVHQGFFKDNKTNVPTLAKGGFFEFIEAGKEAFDKLKELLTSVPIIQAPNWDLPFEIMCDVGNYVIGDVLGQKNGRASHVIYYRGH
uniref:Reverse transcriptase/retrotransposon-derived protein RNase H-like domain-containing protein n=1 Tax=Lactuca sativa TaxID=4236 RepID=A0A9R1WMV4_LACSA|nr:hypothetical protein LSAT_V11C100035070 [Lactuca sativa]